MALEVTYAEVKFKNESKSSSASADSPEAPKVKSTPHPCNTGFPRLFFVSLLILLLLLAVSFFVAFFVFFQKYSQLLEEKNAVKELNHTELTCIKDLTTEDKVWSCCPKNWKPFSSNCYFISTDSKPWNESKESCSSMGAHLLVIRSKEEQDFITKQLGTNAAYYVGLWDPDGQRRWQWVDQTPYNQSATFWHQHEPNSVDERCVMLNYRPGSAWGWNDVPCSGSQKSICQMKKTYL